tara:strand:- start:281 stop:478 length:198 start_codon:yes stop_codon:yes gene_type:complete
MRTLRGLILLGLLVVRSRFRLRGAYWTWRRETAEGSGGSITRGERLGAVLEYARWLDRMHSIART